MDYIVQIVEELTGKLEQLDKAGLIEILKQYALYDDKVRSDLQLRLSQPGKVPEAAIRRFRASFEPCYRRGKHYVRYDDVYEALFGASAVLLIAEGGAGFAPRERMLMCFSVLEEIGRICNDIDDSGEVHMAVTDAIKCIANLAAEIPSAERYALLEEHLRRGRALYDFGPDWTADLLEAINSPVVESYV